MPKTSAPSSPSRKSIIHPAGAPNPDAKSPAPAPAEAFARAAYALFEEFYRGTHPYREKCRLNEEYYRANHWHGQPQKDGEPQPVTPVLFSTLESLLADMMDNYPEPIILGEEASDDETANRLTQVVQFILKHRYYRTTYRRKCRQALKKGASVQEIFWDPTLLGGLGDVNIREIDVRNFVWDPKFENIQDGRGVFTYSFYPLAWFREQYPQKADELRADGYRRERYASDTIPDDGDDVMLLEYWYKQRDRLTGQTLVHMARLAGGILLEDSRKPRPEGMYRHGRYPFIVEPLYPLEGQPVGLGLIDMLKNLQHYADHMDQIILKNALMSGQVKLLVNKNADLDEDALLDWGSEVVRGGRIGDDALRFMQAAPVNPHVFTYQQAKLQAIKDESGQTMYNRGESAGGVTAASAIVALQEAGSKRSRLIIEQMNDGFEALVRMVIDLIEEFYTEQRVFRIRGPQEDLRFEFSADAIRLVDGGRLDFDIAIQIQKQTPYKTLYQNELALQLLQCGIIRPEDALQMMTFEGKEKLIKQRREEGETGGM